MEKRDIDSILLANFYFIKCKFERPDCPKTEIAKKFLLNKIKDILFRRKLQLN